MPVSPRRRFPGWDGLFILGLTYAIVVIWWLRGLDGLGAPVALVLALVSGWLVLTRRLRRPSLPTRRPDGIRPLIAIPTHNNAGTIEDIVRRCRAKCDDVLVIDDGSRDDSGARAEAAGATVLRHDVNRGKGAALDTALRWAAEQGFSHLLCVDADGQLYPEDLPRFLDAVNTQPAVLHAGVRDSESMPVGSQRARLNSNFWVWVETGRWLGDTQCGLRAYPVLPTLALGLPPTRYQWEVEVLTRALWSGLAVADVPCRVYYPPAEERVSSYRKVVDTVRVSWLNTQLVLERILWPARWIRPRPRDEWRGSHRGGLGGYRFFLRILRLFGRRATLAAVTPMGLFYWLIAPAPRRHINAYHRRRRPELSTWAVRRATLATFTQFAWAIVDRFAALEDAGSLPFHRDGLEHLRQTLYAEPSNNKDNQPGVLLLSAHAGNPELATAVLRHAGQRRANIVMHIEPGDPYPALLREVMGDDAPNILPLGGDGVTSLSILHALRRDEAVAMKVDRVVDGNTVTVDFLGQPMRLPTGPLQVAALSGATTLMISAFRQPDGSYQLVSTAPRTYQFTSRQQRQEDLQRWAQELADELAAWTERWPEQWYNFFDVWGAPSS